MNLPSSSSMFAARPLVPPTIAFILGILVGDIRYALVGLLAGVLLTGFAVWFTKRNFWRMGFILVLFALLGAWRTWMTITPPPQDISALIGKGYVTVRGRIASDVYPSTSFLTFQMEVEQVTAGEGIVLAQKGRVAVFLGRNEQSPLVDYGDVLEITGRLQSLNEQDNPGGFNFATYYSRHGVFARLTAKRPTAWKLLPQSTAPSDWLPRIASQCRNSLLNTLHKVLPPIEADLLAGIILGSHTSLPAKLNDDFAATGTAHILAASGMNVTLMALLIGGICKLARVERKKSFLLILGVLAFYTLVSGAKPSILRADVMMSFYLIGKLLDREADGINLLAASALLILFWEPGYLYDAGFQLSFVIVAAVFIVMPFMKRWFPELQHSSDKKPSIRQKIQNEFFGLLLLTFCTHLASAPLTAQHFNQIALLGFLPNALLCPLIAYLMGAGFSVWLIALVSIDIGKVLAWLGLGWVLAYMIGVVRWCAVMPGAVIYVPSPGWGLITLYYAILGSGIWYYSAWLSSKGKYTLS